MNGIQAGHFRNLDETAQGPQYRVGVGKIICYNTQGATAFIQFHDRLSPNVTLGTTIPMFAILLPATTGFVEIDFSPPLMFDTACTMYSTTSAEGNTGSADGVFLQLFVN